MGRGAVLEVRQLFEHKIDEGAAGLNCSFKAWTGHEFHLEPRQVNALVGVTSFAIGVFARKEKNAVSALEKIGCLEGKSPLPALTQVDATVDLKPDRLQTVPRLLDSMETSYSRGISTVENSRGQKWLHQDGYARVPIHIDGADWWREQNLTWVKTSHYLETRNDDGSYFRTYKNGAIQIRFGNGYEVYEGSFPERRKIIMSTGKTDCRAQQQGILSTEASDLENSLKKTGR